MEWNNKWVGHIPTIGILLFLLLFFYAAQSYPGGSQADITSKGYDWVHNYWCNLMNPKAMNGAVNPARPIAIFALFVLCLSLSLFFIQYAFLFIQEVIWQKIVAYCGVIAMLLSAFIYTSLHDELTIAASCFGLFAVGGLIRSVYKSELKWFKIGGIIALLLLAANNWIYYTSQGIFYLPLLQKITFLWVLTWIALLNIRLQSLHN